MAKRKRKLKNRRNFVAIPFNGSQGLATLADDALLTAAIIAAFGEDIYCISMDIQAGLRDFTAGQTPIRFGVAHGDLSIAEIDEFNVAELSDPDDIIQKERSRRPVRKIGAFWGSEDNVQFNGGKMTRVKLGFSVGDGHALNMWVKNQSGAVLTTGAVLEFDGILYGRWQR